MQTCNFLTYSSSVCTNSSTILTLILSCFASLAASHLRTARWITITPFIFGPSSNKFISSSQPPDSTGAFILIVLNANSSSTFVSFGPVASNSCKDMFPISCTFCNSLFFFFLFLCSAWASPPSPPSSSSLFGINVVVIVGGEREGEEGRKELEEEGEDHGDHSSEAEEVGKREEEGGLGETGREEAGGETGREEEEGVVEDHGVHSWLVEREEESANLPRSARACCTGS
mmetsp:Transcript_38453/g.60936  ORF Transcript_38453/g.60936 Transcript_38453/m.60936 type:complete len:230 (-) Transcript_38453:320-1009(-)